MIVRPYDCPTLWLSNLMIVRPYDCPTLWLSDHIIITQLIIRFWALRLEIIPLSPGLLSASPCWPALLMLHPFESQTVSLPHHYQNQSNTPIWFHLKNLGIGLTPPDFFANAKIFTAPILVTSP